MSHLSPYTCSTLTYSHINTRQRGIINVNSSLVPLNSIILHILIILIIFHWIAAFTQTAFAPRLLTLSSVRTLSTPDSPPPMPVARSSAPPGPCTPPAAVTAAAGHKPLTTRAPPNCVREYSACQIRQIKRVRRRGGPSGKPVRRRRPERRKDSGGGGKGRGAGPPSKASAAPRAVPIVSPG